MTKVFTLFQGDNLQLTVDGETFTINRKTNPAFNQIVDAINEGDYETAKTLANPGRALATFYSSNGDYTLEVKSSSVYLNDKRLPRALEDRLLAMYAHGLPLKPLVNFMARVMKNPSATSRSEGYLFLEGNELPLTPDGCFMAYKSVRRWNGSPEFDDSGRKFEEGDYMSIGTNSENRLPTRLRIGDELRMDRGEVDDNRERTCSFGYHFASLNYASTWSRWDAILLMKIDPADVVSIPSDYDNQKGRTCAYTVDSVHVERDDDDLDVKNVPEAFDSPVYNSGDQMSLKLGDDEFRWCVRDNTDNKVIARFRTREQARDYRRNMSVYLAERCHLYDDLSKQNIR